MNKFVAKYGRILVPLITPYGENEEVDYVQYEKLIDYIITNKLGDSLIVTGTTGEASLLTFDEKSQVDGNSYKCGSRTNASNCRNWLCKY
mgnify:CR=1 FL=1